MPPSLGNPAIVLPGLAPGADAGPVIDQMVRRASSLGFGTWWQRAESVGFCAHPIQLVGSDKFGRQQAVWTRCNNRRATVCPSCADLYARDTWQLVHAGTAGGHHTMPAAVADRPQVFATFTAPSFGPVHNSTGGVCRDHRRVGGYTRCPHGKPLWCNHTHQPTDAWVGEPLCPQCYDYLGHVLFSWHVPELWRRFTIALRRTLTKALNAAGCKPGCVRVSFVKVVEMQARAIPHIHALIRLDPATDDGDPNHHGPAAARGGGETRYPHQDGWESPITATELAALIQQAARTATVTIADPAPGNDPDHTPPLTVRFGPQIDTQPLASEHTADHDDSDEQVRASARLSPRRVAGYLAKYVTKSLADFGISARRLSTEAISELNVSEHVRAILTTIANLADAGMAGIGRWLHTLGYRGHITTKSRRYSTTMTALRARRAAWTRHQHTKTNAPLNNPYPPVADIDDAVVWEFDRAGHTCLGDRALVISAAYRHIERRLTGRDAQRHQCESACGVPDG